MAITFATFAAYGVPRFGDDVIEQLVLFTSSIRKTHGPEAVTVLLTDEIFADDRALPLFSIVRRRPVAGNTLLFDRARHYRDFLGHHDWQSHVALLDFDILVMKDLHTAFCGLADIYVTTRMWSENMPINGGVIFLEKTRPDACRRFYDDVVEIYGKVSAKDVAWYGDQVALRYAVLSGAAQLQEFVVQTRSGALVGFLARDDFNYTPYDVDSGREIPQIPEPADVALFKDRPILHFKGPRKHLMPIIARAAWPQSTTGDQP